MALDREKALNNAQKYLQKGNLSRALTEYQKLAQDDPRDARVWLRIGDLLARTGDRTGACDAYQKVANLYADGGFFLKAVAVYKQITKLDPSRLDAFEQLAAMYQNLDLLSDAITALMRLAEQAASLDRFVDAEKALRRVCDLDPANLPARVRLAETLSKLDKAEGAADEFETGARLLYEQERFEDYAKVAERLLYHSQHRVHVARQLAEVYLKLDEPKRALAKLQVAFRVNPQEPTTLALLSDAFEALGQTSKTVSVLLELARIYQERGDIVKRQDAYARVLRLDPGNEDARRALGTEAAPAAPEAFEDFDELDELSLEDESDEMIELSQDDLELVQDLPNEPTQVETQQKEVARLFAECEVFVRYGLRAKARDQYGRLLKLEPLHTEAREKLKDLLLEDGEFEEAAFHLKELAKQIANDSPGLAQQYREQADALVSGNAPEMDEEEFAFEDEAEALPEPEEEPRAVTPVEDVLDEADFFIAQGLYDAAHASINEVLIEHATNPLLLEKLEEIRELMLSSAMTDDATHAEVNIDDLQRPKEGARPLSLGVSQGAGSDDIDAMLDGLEMDGGSSEGSESHYDLGIAYRQMGLLDEAIQEFELGIVQGESRAACIMMIAHCFREQGSPESARDKLKSGLDQSGQNKDEMLALRYELAQTYVVLGMSREASAELRQVVQTDPNYRDARVQLDTLLGHA